MITTDDFSSQIDRIDKLIGSTPADEKSVQTIYPIVRWFLHDLNEFARSPECHEICGIEGLEIDTEVSAKLYELEYHLIRAAGLSKTSEDCRQELSWCKTAIDGIRMNLRAG